MSARLIVYFPLADPAAQTAILDLYAEAGVDIVELGRPSPSPYHDGIDVTASMARAASGDPLAVLVAARQRLARHSKPPKARVMTYSDPGHPTLSVPAFFDGADALLVVAPPRDARREAIETRARTAGVAVSTFLPLPMTSADIIAARLADGYVLLQAAPSLTGPRTYLDPANGARIAKLRAEGVGAPIVLGFGISNGEQARAAVGLGAIGVVVGSAALNETCLSESMLHDFDQNGPVRRRRSDCCGCEPSISNIAPRGGNCGAGSARLDKRRHRGFRCGVERRSRRTCRRGRSLQSSQHGRVR
jgi:tryptophan synthase alpha chain